MDAHSPIRTVDKLILALGGNKALGDLLGVSSPAVSNWRAANAFPDRVKYRVSQLITERGIDVDPTLLDRSPDWPQAEGSSETAA